MLVPAGLACIVAYFAMKQSSAPPKRAMVPGNEYVVLLHGIMRSPKSMEKIQHALEERGYRVVNFGYPSTKESIADCADILHEEMKKLPSGCPVSFVTHSMGGIVVRYYLAHYREIPVRRFVMIAPPNRGSSLARRLKAIPLYPKIFGRAGMEVAKDSHSVIEDLPSPRCEFGVIAGGLGRGSGVNPLIPGDDDMTVGIEETKLPGMKDFIRIEGQHSLLLNQKRVADNVISFLENGSFIH